MKPRSRCLPPRLRRSAAGVALAAGCTACGGSIEFQDTTPIRIEAAAPALEVQVPEPAPVEEKPIEVRDDRVEIQDTVQFAYDSAQISREAASLLEDVAATLKQSPHVEKVVVEGHASAEGSEAHNQRLSADRAQAVVRFLVSQGVEKNRLSRAAYGESRPVADNDSESGRRQNRRVEFNVTDQKVTQQRIEKDPETGEERVVETVAHNGKSTR